MLQNGRCNDGGAPESRGDEVIVSQQAKWALSQIENALLKRDELSALNQVNTYITQLEEKADRYERALRKAEARFARLYDLSDGGVGFCKIAIAPEQTEGQKP